MRERVEVQKMLYCERGALASVGAALYLEAYEVAIPESQKPPCGGFGLFYD